MTQHPRWSTWPTATISSGLQPVVLDGVLLNRLIRLRPIICAVVNHIDIGAIGTIVR